jgi:hypothetical protein
MVPAETIVTPGQLLRQSFREHMRNAVHSAAYGDSSGFPGSETDAEIAGSFLHVSSFGRPIEVACETSANAQAGEEAAYENHLKSIGEYRFSAIARDAGIVCGKPSHPSAYKNSPDIGCPLPRVVKSQVK